jgi:uncharacterized cupredoxin-like copper-binding protein
MRSRPASRRRPALLTALLLVAGVGLVASLHPPPTHNAVLHPAAGVDTVSVTVGTALQFTPGSFEVNPGDSVTVTVTQTDSLPHTFTLSSSTYQFDPNTNSSTDLAAFFAKHAPLVNLSLPDHAASASATFTAPTAVGAYQFLCLAPGHFQAGMWGLMGDGVAVGAPTTNNGPGAPVFIIGGTIATLVVIAIVLAFVIGRRQGAMHQMEPERLGYPEPTPASGPTAPRHAP